MTKMIEVPATEANNYSRILTLLGMEEEGDPVAAIEQLKADADVGAKWRQNSSLKEWFPLTVEQLQPLSKDRLTELFRRDESSWGYGRAVEEAHGIFVTDAVIRTKVITQYKPQAAP